jgi:hypothetical protein
MKCDRGKCPVTKAIYCHVAARLAVTNKTGECP